MEDLIDFTEDRYKKLAAFLITPLKKYSGVKSAILEVERRLSCG